MTSTTITTSNSISAAACENHKRSVDEAFINKMKGLVDRLRNDNTTLKESLDAERSGVRTLKASYEASIRNLKMDFKKKEENLEKQIRQRSKMEPNQNNDESNNGSKVELKKLTNEVQTFKAANKDLQVKIKVVQAAEMARVAELRAQVAKHNALELASEKQARLTSRKLLEEIKSKERVIIQLRREIAKYSSNGIDQAQRMEGRVLELSKKFCLDQDKDRKINRGSLKTDIQHRKENLKRDSPGSEGDSGTSSAPPSLSPQPLNDMWSCGQCRAAEARAQTASRECARLADALRDARDQLELMEFRILELEDAAPDKSPRDNLTDSDSGCVSPGSRIKDSASPELKRMDSGYKSPQNTPSSPCTTRRMAQNEDFKEDFAKAQVLADVLDRNSETSDSLRSNPVKDHLELMILNAGSAEDRSCLEQVLILLYNYQALSSSVSEEDFQIRPKRSSQRPDEATKIQKAIATVSPYSQKGYKCDLFESFDERKTTNILQESGIFEESLTEARGTQTEVNDAFECSGELNTEIQRLNSIREKLEKQGVRNRSLTVKEDVEGLECRCVKLGKKHKQYYERRLKFLEGKISIYEAAQDVKQAKLAERLQKEFILENRVQELESQILDLQDKYERLEEECCELEEIENDTRLHWQQLEVDYELCSAQLRDMTEERECSRAQAERLISELTTRELTLKAREKDLLIRLSSLEKAVPALIVWNMMRVVGMKISLGGQRAILNRITPYNTNNKQALVPVSNKHLTCEVTAVWNNVCFGDSPETTTLRQQITDLLKEKQEVESLKKNLEDKIQALEDNIAMLKRQLSAAESGAEMKKISLEKRIFDLEERIRHDKEKEKQPMDQHTTMKLRALLISEQELKTRVAELERREQAYLEMLTQADDMWAEMEGGYKKKIDSIQMVEAELTGKIKQLEADRDEWKKCFEPLKRKLKEVEESESVLRVALDKSERDTKSLMAENDHLKTMVESAKCEQKKSETALQMLSNKFKKEQDHLRKLQRQATSDVATQKETLKKTEQSYKSDLESVRRELKIACKSAQELECNNSELKEEVESLEKQLSLTQKALSQCKRRCDEKIKTLSHELSIKTEELEELRSETMRQIRASRMELKPDRTEYIDEGYTISVPMKDYGRMHHSMNYITSESRCSCPTMRSHLVGQLIEDLFERIHNTADDDLTRLCKEIVPANGRTEATVETKAKITNYLLMAISKELVRSIGDADAKTDTEEWQRTASSITYSVPNFPASGKFASLRLEGNAGVLNGASRLASVSCACAAARLCAAAPELTDSVKVCQEEVLENSDVKIMEEQLANAIESIVNCPSCALGSNAIVWSTDV